MTVFPDALIGLARDGNAGGTALKVLVWAWSELGHETWDLIDVEQAAKAICISPSAYRKGLRRLLAEGIVESKGRNPRLQWRLTPIASWRASVEKYEATYPQRLTAALASAELETRRPVRARRKAGERHGQAKQGD